MTTPFLINHLWQSSCSALLAGLLSFVLRRNSPKVRYWVWLSASLKFLVPFALLVSLESVFSRPAQYSVSVASPVLPNDLVQIAAPFSPAPSADVPAHPSLDWTPVAISVVWILGFLAITLARCRSWLEVRATLRASTPIELPIPVQTLITPGVVEPGIVGFLRPVLVLPAQLLERLNPRQLDAVLAHELCQVRRRDNLFAALHMVVEAIFWFDPLVWWIGSRMVEERELACDEEVLRLGCEPADYVEGILKVCRFYVESSLPCISGVAGADVKKRLRAILAGRVAHKLSAARKVTLSVIGLAALTVPVLIGVWTVPAIRAQNAPSNPSVPPTSPKIEVASIKLNVQGGVRGMRMNPGRFIIVNTPVRTMMRNAYKVPDYAILGGPAWIDSDAYDIEAKVDGTLKFDAALVLLRSLLEDRFQLKIHRETKEGPVYLLTLAKGGAKMPPSNCTVIDPAHPPSPPQPGEKAPDTCGSNRGGGLGPVRALNIAGLRMDEPRTEGVTVPGPTFYLSQILQRPVIDKTALSGRFDVHLEYAPSDRPAGEPLENSPDIFTAVQEQLGLKLEAGKGPVERLIIDRVERPSEN